MTQGSNVQLRKPQSAQLSCDGTTLKAWSDSLLGLTLQWPQAAHVGPILII